MLSTLWHNSIVHGAVSGLLAAALIDLRAFLTWKKVQDAMTYDWKIAVLRWAQGAVTGALAAGGFALTS